MGTNILERIRTETSFLGEKTEAVVKEVTIEKPTPKPRAVKKSFRHSSEELEEYWKSVIWQELRFARLELDGYRCIVCNKLATQVHHVRYPEVLGTESVEDDLRSMCGECHFNHHKGSSDLRDLREHVEIERIDGIVCPVCTLKVKEWKHTMNGPAVADLICLVGMSPDGIEFFHIDEFIHHSRGGNFSKLKFWGLAERQENQDDTKRTSGIWRPTRKGIDFVRGRITVPKYAHKFKEDTWLSGEELSVREVLSKKFNYTEMMQENFPDWSDR